MAMTTDEGHLEAVLLDPAVRPLAHPPVTSRSRAGRLQPDQRLGLIPVLSRWHVRVVVRFHASSMTSGTVGTMHTDEFACLVATARESLRSGYAFGVATEHLRASALPPAAREMLDAMTAATDRWGVDARDALAFVEQRFFAPDASGTELAVGFLLTSAGFAAERSVAAMRG